MNARRFRRQMGLQAWESQSIRRGGLLECVGLLTTVRDNSSLWFFRNIIGETERQLKISQHTPYMVLILHRATKLNKSRFEGHISGTIQCSLSCNPVMLYVSRFGGLMA